MNRTKKKILTHRKLASVILTVGNKGIPIQATVFIINSKYKKLSLLGSMLYQINDHKILCQLRWLYHVSSKKNYQILNVLDFC